jgi:hypothetical protein
MLEELRMTQDPVASGTLTGGPAGDPGPVEDQWVFLIDPDWKPENEGAQPPMEAIVGGWLTEPDGTTSSFRANPEYQPSGPDAPTDPVDATVRLVTQGRAEAEDLMAVLRDAELAVALDEEETALVVPAPDDVPSVLVTTAPVNQRWVTGVSIWRATSAAELAGALPDEGVDVLINPGAPASIRLIGRVLKEALVNGSVTGQPATAVEATS